MNRPLMDIAQMSATSRRRRPAVDGLVDLGHRGAPGLAMARTLRPLMRWRMISPLFMPIRCSLMSIICEQMSTAK
jgi:hypothetical protein